MNKKLDKAIDEIGVGLLCLIITAAVFLIAGASSTAGGLSGAVFTSSLLNIVIFALPIIYILLRVLFGRKLKKETYNTAIIRGAIGAVIISLIVIGVFSIK